MGRVHQCQTQNLKTVPRTKIIRLQSALLLLGADPRDVLTQKQLDQKPEYNGLKTNLAPGKTIMDRPELPSYVHEVWSTFLFCDHTFPLRDKLKDSEELAAYAKARRVVDFKQKEEDR
jgi:hypothetical protein